MSQNYKYFVIPFENVSEVPACTIWYATWSNTPPICEPGMSAPLIIGVTEGEVPKEGTLVGTMTKDPPPPPPPVAGTAVDLSDYASSFDAWSELGRDT